MTTDTPKIPETVAGNATAPEVATAATVVAEIVAAVAVPETTTGGAWGTTTVSSSSRKSGEEEQHPESVTAEELLEIAETGDLLLEHSTSWMYSFWSARYGTRFDKAMILVKNMKAALGLDLKGVWVIDPICGDKLSRSGNLHRRHGYKIVPLSDVLAQARHRGVSLMYRKVGIPARKMKNKMLKTILPTRANGQNYLSVSPRDMVRAKFGVDLAGDNPEGDRHWSAMLVAFVLVCLGVLREDISWFMLSPSKFGHLRENRLGLGKESKKEIPIEL